MISKPGMFQSGFSEEDEKPLAILHHLGGIPQGGLVTI